MHHSDNSFQLPPRGSHVRCQETHKYSGIAIQPSNNTQPILVFTSLYITFSSVETAHSASISFVSNISCISIR